MQFTTPTLITITAPTCSGKSVLLEYLAKQGFTRIVGTTTRPPRRGEIEGIHYNFLTPEISEEMEIAGEFAELVTFRGVRYGVTHAEMAKKMTGDSPPIVILEPSGIELYRTYCQQHNWGIFKVYVNTKEATRIERLNSRTAADIQAAAIEVSADGALEGLEGLTHILALERFEKLLRTHTDRVLSITTEERAWSNTYLWDAIVTGENCKKAFEDLLHGITWRNSRNNQLNT